ncbi:MAG: sulfotransferase, partial [Deltaproteobacteria bacterium]
MRNSGRNYRPIFVAGASGSGTSFLAVALGQRFDCAGVIYETNLQVSKRSVLYVPPIDVFESVASYQHAMGPHESWSVEAGRRDLLDLYRSYGSGRSDVVIDKGPDINLLRAGFLHRCFPDGRFLLVFRDPVTNVEGLRRKWPTFAHDPLAESIRFYAEIHERFLRETEAFPDRVIAVEYESLVEHHEETLLAIGRRLGLAPARRQRRLRPAANVE